MNGRILAAVVIALTSGAAGYFVHGAMPGSAIPAETVAAPPPDSIRVLYSLTAKRNDREVIALIDSAQQHVYFAM